MTQTFLQMFLMARSRLINLLPNISEHDLSKKLAPESNSIGFLLRHIGEVEQLFAKNVFGLDIKLQPTRLGKQRIWEDSRIKWNYVKIFLLLKMR